MLRMYSVMQLQQVWQKPEEVHQPDEQVLSPSLPVVQEEEEDEQQQQQQQKIAEGPVVQDTSAATATTDAAEDVAVVAKEVIPSEPVFVEEPMTIDEPVGIEKQPAEEPIAEAPAAAAVETVTVEFKTKANNDNNEDNKRDSKISTGSTSLLPQTQEDKALPPTASSTLASRATSIRTVEEHQHPSPPTPKVSRSSQIQAKLSTQRRNFSRKLKRTFSMSSTTSTKSQTL